MNIQNIRVNMPENVNVIIGQSHFIKTVEDIYEALVNTVPTIKFGVAFCEASGACKIRSEGNDAELKKLAEKNTLNIGAGHSFIVFMNDCFPLNVLNAIQSLPEVCNIYCATANPTTVVLAQSKQGNGILGVIDGFSPKGVENKEEFDWRKKFLRDIGYKL